MKSLSDILWEWYDKGSGHNGNNNPIGIFLHRIQYIILGLKYHYKFCCVVAFARDFDNEEKFKQRRLEGTFLTEDSRVPCERCFKRIQREEDEREQFIIESMKYQTGDI